MKTSVIKLNNGGRTYYSLNNMATAEDYKLVVNILKELHGASFVQKLGAVYWYAEKYEYLGRKFVLGLDDDLECYFEATDKNNTQEDETWLEQLVEQIVDEINNR
ncbi:MAG: hypothetical protein LBC20_14980 [Planctomycetaceae bacterium]|jgi:hypothetical protein|nr:hypothetical protein [Planctomycetaceae bacterium]